MAKIHGKIKKLVNNVNYDRIQFPVREKDLARLKKRITFALTCFILKTS